MGVKNTRAMWFAPILEALKQMDNGQGKPIAVRQKIIEMQGLSGEILTETTGKNGVNKLENEIAFARNYLVQEGYIDKSTFGVWRITEAGRKAEMNEEIANAIISKWNKISAQKRAQQKTQNDTMGDSAVRGIHYWLYTPGKGAECWQEFRENGIMAIGWGKIGDLTTFSTKEAMKQKMKETYDPDVSYTNAAHATWEFLYCIEPGDIVFAKQGLSKIIGRGVVASDYEYFEYGNKDYCHVRQVNWTEAGEWDSPKRLETKTLTDITPYTELVENIQKLFGEETEEEEPAEQKYEAYTEQDFLNDVFMTQERYQTMKRLLELKKNVILQGAPGVGKTYAAKRLAYSLMGEKDKDRIMMVQFHQSYSYEDFVMGWRPDGNGFKLNQGCFYEFCKKAEEDSDNTYYFIIDEINRGNLSKIFGELFMLIEADKRGISICPTYSKEQFSIPKNLYIIGMMNTADRSLAMMDYALRRRFAFFDIEPAFESEGFKKWKTQLGSAKFDRLIAAVIKLNQVIAEDDTLGPGFRIGHSYFMAKPENITETWMKEVVDYELDPLLKEYWFDEPQKAKTEIDKLRGVLRDSDS